MDIKCNSYQLAPWIVSMVDELFPSINGQPPAYSKYNLMTYMISGRCRGVVGVSETDYLVSSMYKDIINMCRYCHKSKLLYKLMTSKHLSGDDFNNFSYLLFTRGCQTKAISSIHCEYGKNRCYTCRDIKIFLQDRNSIDIDTIFRVIYKTYDVKNLRTIYQKYDHLIRRDRI